MTGYFVTDKHGRTELWYRGDDGLGTYVMGRGIVDAAVFDAAALLLTEPDDALRRRMAQAIHDHACNGDPEEGCAWTAEHEPGLPCDLDQLLGFADAVLAALREEAAS